MAQVLVRELDPEVVERLKERAKVHGRSLQKEIRAILEEASTTLSMQEAREAAELWRDRLEGREHSDSAGLVREGRER